MENRASRYFAVTTYNRNQYLVKELSDKFFCNCNQNQYVYGSITIVPKWQEQIQQGDSKIHIFVIKLYNCS